MSSKRISSNPDFMSVLAHRARRNFPLAASVVVLALAAGTLAAAGLAGKIAYVCGGPGGSSICLFDLTTGTNSRLAVSGANPRLSPDGSMIALSGIKVMNSDGTNLRSLTTFGGTPAWSPDGLKLAFGASGSSGIWVINLDGSGLTQLTDYGMKPAWAPDGTQIAFSSFKDSPDSDIWLMNPDGTNAHRVLSRRGEDIDVAWSFSPRILFAGVVDQKASYEIFAFDPITFSLNRLTDSSRQDFEPGASPDGAMIVFASFRKTAGIYAMNADGSSPQLIIAGGRQPSWGP